MIVEVQYREYHQFDNEVLGATATDTICCGQICWEHSE